MDLPKVYVLQTQVDFADETEIRFALGLPQEGVTDNLNLAAIYNDRDVGVAHMGMLAGYISHPGHPFGLNQLLVNIVAREPISRTTTIHLALREIHQDSLELGEALVTMELHVSTGVGEPVRVTFGNLNTNPAGSPLISL